MQHLCKPCRTKKLSVQFYKGYFCSKQTINNKPLNP